MKKIFNLKALFLSLLFLFPSMTATAAIAPVNRIEASLIGLLEAAGEENIQVYDSAELTAEILENRLGTTIVERCIGMVTDVEAGDGIVLNAQDELYNYISYRGIYRPIRNGSLILSYMVYSPDNNYIDDIVERYDFILKE